MKYIISSLHKETGQRLKELRNLLLLSVSSLSKATNIPRPTIVRIEKGNDSKRSAVEALILFYGYSIPEFYRFGKLPTESNLRKRIQQFHKKNHSQSFKIINDQPDLIEIIEHKILKNYTLFNDWVGVKTVHQFCLAELGYNYTNVSGTLLTAVKKRKILILKKDPRAANENFNVYKRR